MHKQFEICRGKPKDQFRGDRPTPARSLTPCDMASRVVIANMDSLLLRRSTLPNGACLGCTSPRGPDSRPCDEFVQLRHLELVGHRVPHSFFYGAPMLCSHCTAAVNASGCADAGCQSLSSLALAFDADTLLACGEAHRDALAKVNSTISIHHSRCQSTVHLSRPFSTLDPRRLW